MKIILKIIISVYIIFMISSCADHIVSECEECNPLPDNTKLSTFSGIQTNLFNTTCALSGCHGETGTQANLLLVEGISFSNLVNQQSLLYPQFLRVKPGDSENSLLIKMLRGEISIMPPTGKINDAIIDSVAMWIDEGALNN